MINKYDEWKSTQPKNEEMGVAVMATGSGIQNPDGPLLTAPAKGKKKALRAILKRKPL